ncbi:MAG: glycoside hydrolase family 95 protein [Fermentimonas sp.]|nr:glycoside hydrolase family 95 protein [Fermentimonas sp.]MDD2930931.1 glycoside hydrolase family 95 protein [Fermentimonas sp.]MDD3188855.1 glycoside hydrolase family 95 protein [Fermentimonas sp.]MDD4284656.1 glycoside hydrolase family 95 protein [Fermentimonas sp.]MDD4724570.1 glycoside hydrolase family 95 protein [Fermentimonas sp.]
MIKTKKRAIWYLLITFTLTGVNLSAQDLKLRYDQPAKVWEEAIPLGNSRLGAMIYGIPDREEIQLNEETIWGGGPYRNDNPKALDALPEVRKLIFEEKNGEADKLINQTFFTQTHGMPFQTAGSVILEFPGHKNFKNYTRELDLNRAVATTRYQVDGVEYTREAFSSFADDVFIMRITANKKGALNFEAGYYNQSEHTVFKRENALILEGKGSEHEGIEGAIRYQTHTNIKNTDGNVKVTDNKIFVNNATSVVLYISIATNFTDYKTVDTDHAMKAEQLLSSAVKKKFTSAMKEHIRIYGEQFKRFSLSLGSLPGTEKLTTTQRILNFQNDQDPSMVTLLSQFGRYLLISSSQPGGQPANLQGIWCNSMQPAWDSKYTININTEMNYWPAEVTNLPETHEPLFKMLKELSVSGQETASKLYGADGWVAHHNTDLWRVTSPIDFAAAGMWPTGGAWLCQHLWEHYLFTGDKKFLKEIYPVLKGSADFFMSSLIEHPKYGWMVVSPSVSPEQGPITAGCTMDNQLVFDILTRTAEANQILNGNKEYRTDLLTMAAKLPPMQIGKYSQLQEWLEDVDDPKNEHRHVSHLYGLYPGNQISPYSTPELFEAARNSLNYRGDMATGWSIGWKVNLWARLLDGNHAYKIIKNMLTLAGRDNRDGRTYPNLFTAHPPFQIDGNFGLTAGVAEMLLQSHDGAVHILPALPDNWKEGSVHGIMARGGFEISMEWKEGKVAEVTVHSRLGGNLRLRTYTRLLGENMVKAEGENPNNFFKPFKTASPIISDKATLKGVSLTEVLEYDIPTRAGKTYKFVAAK